MTTTLYLVRHGETDLNASNRCQGSMDVPMNAAGELQVTVLRQRLADVRFDVAYTSPLIRASTSARILLGDSGIPLRPVPALSEMSYGAWQGTTYSDWGTVASAQWQNTPWAMEFPEGETLHKVRARALPALEEIVRQHANETVLVTAHGHLNRVLLIALKPELQFWEIRQPNCATWKLVFDVNVDDEIVLLSAAAVEETVTVALAQHAIDAKAKPQGALGYIENCGVRLAVLQQTLFPWLTTTRICIFAADHGVSVEGVSAYPRAVTAEMMRNFSAGGAAINALARANDVQLEVLDVGVDAILTGLTDIRHEKVRRSSQNLASEAAMSAPELAQAMAVGANAVKRAVRDGVSAIGLGEMGIGNTTSAAALLSVLTGTDALETVGVGTGVAAATLSVKREVVTRAVALHGCRSAGNSARECLRRVGGLEMAAIAGAVLESMHHSVAIVCDGFISTVAVLSAACIAEEDRVGAATTVGARLFLAHRSSERGHALAIESLITVTNQPLRPLLDLDMRLGEGTGAALAMPLLRAAAAIMREMATFESAGVSGGGQTRTAADVG